MSSDLHYEVIEAASLKDKPLLVDSNGNTFNIKSNRHAGPKKTTWRCSVRNKTTACKATVIQDGETFTAGLHNHCHPAQPGKQKAIKIVADIKNKAREDVLRSAAAIVEDAILKEIKPEDPEASVPKPGLLIRRAHQFDKQCIPRIQRTLNLTF